MRFQQRSTCRAFTLVELLVVIGIIIVLIGILLPIVVAAGREARDVKCKSNMRQVGLAMLNYAAENKGKFPPNLEWMPVTLHWNIWTDADRIGRYLRNSDVRRGILNPEKRVFGGVLVCPEDEQASLSYAMNYFASSAAMIEGKIQAPQMPRVGIGWNASVKRSSQMILVTEMRSHFADGYGGFECAATQPNIAQAAGNLNLLRWYPGIEFMGYLAPFGGAGNPGDRYWPAKVWIDYARHRRRADGGTSYGDVRGRANFCFADGHVASFKPDDRANRDTRRSKLVALWSPIDAAVDRLPRPAGY